MCFAHAAGCNRLCSAAATDIASRPSWADHTGLCPTGLHSHLAACNLILNKQFMLVLNIFTAYTQAFCDCNMVAKHTKPHSHALLSVRFTVLTSHFPLPSICLLPIMRGTSHLHLHMRVVLWADRFDRELVFPLPNSQARASILDIHTRKWSQPPAAELQQDLAHRCVGYCGADLKVGPQARINSPICALF